MAKNILPLHAIHECGTTMLELVEGGIAYQEMQVLKSFFKGLNSITAENIEKLENGCPFLGTHFAFPAELFYCFDVVPVCFESLSYLTSAILTDGSEKFLPLGSSEYKDIGPGEYSYIDDSNEIICRLEVRQVEKTKIKLSTKNCFYIIQGNEYTDRNYIKGAVDELISLTSKYCGGKQKILYELF